MASFIFLVILGHFASPTCVLAKRDVLQDAAIYR